MHTANRYVADAKRKGKCVTIQRHEKHAGGAEIHFHSFLASQLDKVDGQLHAPTALPPVI